MVTATARVAVKATGTAMAISTALVMALVQEMATALVR
jgi:hypothetical protein